MKDSKALLKTSLPKQAYHSAQHSSFQASHPIHFALNHYSLPLSSHIHTAHTHFPTKHLLSGPHAGQMFLITVTPAAHKHDATKSVMFYASSSQPGAHTQRKEMGKE